MEIRIEELKLELQSITKDLERADNDIANVGGKIDGVRNKFCKQLDRIDNKKNKANEEKRSNDKELEEVLQKLVKVDNSERNFNGNIIAYQKKESEFTKILKKITKDLEISRKGLLKRDSVVRD